jgi:hypothetical protein
MSTKSKSHSLPAKAKGAILIFSLAAVVVIILSVISQQHWSLGRFAIFLALAVATARKKVQLGGTSTVSLLTPVVLLAVMLDGPGAAVLVAICGVLVQTIQPNGKLTIHQAAFNSSMITLTVAGTSTAYHAIAHGQDFSAALLAMLVASMIYFLGNSVFVAIIVGLSKNTSIVRVWRDHFANTAPSFLIAGMLSLTMFQLVSNPVMLLVVAMIYPVYYSSVRLASRQLA